MNNNTQNFRLELADCCIQYPTSESITNFLQFLNEKQDVYNDWIKFYTALRASDSSLTDVDIATAMKVSVSTVGRFKRSIPSKREYVIMLAAIFGKNVAEAKVMLTRYAHYSDFYPKSQEDNIWLYIISQGKCLTPWNTFETLLTDIKAMAETVQNSNDNNLRKNTVNMGADLMSSLGSLNSFMWFMTNNSSEYGYAYMHLRRIILNRIKNADTGEIKENSDRAFANSYFKNDAFLDRHYHEMDKMKRGLPPTRDYIIALGLHLGYLVDDINDLLKKANYSELCIKDSLETCIYFALSDIDVKAPAYSGDELLTCDEERETAQAMIMQQDIICKTIENKGLAKVVKDYLLTIKNSKNLPEQIRNEITESFLKLL